MRDMMGMMKKAQELQEKLSNIQGELETISVEGSAGGGLVTITMNGKGEPSKIHIDNSLMKDGETEILEDLLITALRDAKTKTEAASQEKMSELTGGLPLPPGMKLF